MNTVYYYGQDGEVVTDEIKQIFDLDERELRWSDDVSASVYNVVGFVFKDNNTLTIFPKHYYNSTEIENYNLTHDELSYDIQLLYKVIRKYSESASTSVMAISYLGAEDGYDSDYPFKPFYEIYDYFQRYGLYKEREEQIIAGSSGKISWKKTIEKAQKIVSGGNLIFAPLFCVKKNSNASFITDCMAFVIDYTIDHFHSFMIMEKTGFGFNNFDYLENYEFVISQLNQYKSAVFKDIHKRLIESLIDFFEQYKHQARIRGGKVHVRIRYFDMIWQKMLDVYVNEHFVGMDPTGEIAVFDAAQSFSPVNFHAKIFDDIDDSSHHFFINIDHVACDNDILYIFDSKYYFKVKSMNYKQFAYNEILRYHYPTVNKIYNMLLLPGSGNSKLHFSLAADYVGDRTMGTKIIEQYFEPKAVMEDYVKHI